MVTVPTMTRNVAGRSLFAPPMPRAMSGAEKVAAVDAATTAPSRCVRSSDLLDERSADECPRSPAQGSDRRLFSRVQKGG
jgi:hypothetical protein